MNCRRRALMDERIHCWIDIIMNTVAGGIGRAYRQERNLPDAGRTVPDLVIYLGNKTYLCDVVVSDTLANTNLSASSRRPGQLAKEKAKKKEEKYERVASAMGAVHLPFSVETMGGLSESAQQLIREIHHHSAHTEVGFCRVRYSASATRYTGQSHIQYLVPGRAVTHSSLVMTQRISARNRSLRQRAVSSVSSPDAQSTGAHDAAIVAASTSLPDALPSADRQPHAQGDAGERGLRAVGGGGVDGGELCSTDSGVRVGLSVHSGQVLVGPPARSISDASTVILSTSNSHYTIDAERVCTPQSCSHCCTCHVLHNSTGYGRCMKSANVPWPDCNCAGKCESGRCAQPECSSNHLLAYLNASNPDSNTVSPSLATRPHRSSSRISRHTPRHAVSADPLPSPVPSPAPDVRRSADGVHVAKEVCTGPQAVTHASVAAAHRQPPTAVFDSGLVVSARVVDAEEKAEVLTDGSVRGVGNTHNTPPTEHVADIRPLPSDVLASLPSLSCQPHRIAVIADGRCAVASVLLARRVIPDSHNTARDRRTIDAARRRLGRSLADKWTEAEWIKQVPLHLRRDRSECGPRDGQQLRRSYSVYGQLLSKGRVTEWLDHSVFYLASAEYNIGVFIVYNEGYASHSTWLCAHVGADKQQHVVLFHSGKHYECVEYDGQRQFPAGHELVVRLAHFAAAHPVHPPEDDLELQALAAHDLSDQPGAVQSSAPSSAVDAPTAGVRQLSPLVAQVAQHGPLYDRVSFHNHPQWRAANEPLWNAYRVASMTGQHGQLTAILLDILQLPQRVLPKLGRSGRAARRRAVAGASRRMRSEADRVRAQYSCPAPDSQDAQQATMSIDTMASTAAQGGFQRSRRAASVVAREAIRQQAADTTDAATDTESEADIDVPANAPAGSDEDEADEPSLSLDRLSGQRTVDADTRAVRRANYLVQCGLTRKAGQVLHSTTQMADMRTAAVQEAMLRLHPQSTSGTSLPDVPQTAPHSVLEDDADTRRLIAQSDNGTAAGPSGWGGNMLSILVQSDICRLGIIALLRDIMNGDLSDDARQLLLASRLVALAKPNDAGYRPIAVGELFYRLAAVVAVRRVTSEAAELLVPHQYGIGVAGGAEKILHSLQHELADSDKRLALLQLDITNAFNTCDRARLLRELYGLSALQSLFRIADFAYSQPTALVLTGCDGLMVESAQGVRQGDPLSALLFCVYMRTVLHQASEQTGVRVYGFFDDISLLGTPQQLTATLGKLQSSLSAVSLQLNTAKSHFTYFHDRLTPLSASVLSTLSTSNIQHHHDWVPVVGAVVGRDDAAVRDGMRSMLEAAGDYDAFLRRVQLDDMPTQTAMLLLRACMVPAMNYYMRCIAPVCIDDEAHRFDERMLEATLTKLGLDDTERSEKTVTLLQRKLRDGGWGLTAAVRTSPAAFLGSLATCYTEPVFTQYSGAVSLPCPSQLHGWIEDGLRRVRLAAPGDAYQAAIEQLLPISAGTFFIHYSTSDSSTATTLQRALSAKANEHTIQAAVKHMKGMSRLGDKWEWARHKAITARGAWGWKVVRPEDPRLRLANVEYEIAARLNLGLQPFSAHAMAALPEHCTLCTHNRTGAPVSLRDDPWHWLTCSRLTGGELRHRHDAIADAIGRVAWQVGAQVKREVEGLEADSKQRPDLQIVFPGRMLLTDVVVSHSLTAATVVLGKSAATLWQGRKNRKYATLASRLGAELLNMSVDACGGMADDAARLVQVIGEEGERWSMGTWSSGSIERNLLGAIAVAVQKGNAMALLVGYTRVRAQAGPVEPA